MNIGIDGRAAKWYRGTGIGTYTYQLISNINNIDNINIAGFLDTTTIFPKIVNDNATGNINTATPYPKINPIGIPIIDNFKACFIIIFLSCFEVVPIVFNNP